MWKHKNFINLQLCGFIPGIIKVNVYVNGTIIELTTSNEVWADSQEYNTSFYSIVGNTVVWQDGTILQYNSVDVLPTDTIIYNGQYTTRASTPQPTLTFKHFFDAGTIGSGTVKFRHYSQQGGGGGAVTPKLTKGTWRWLTPFDAIRYEALKFLENNTTVTEFTSGGKTFTGFEYNAKYGNVAYSSDTEYVDVIAGYDEYVNETYKDITVTQDFDLSEDDFLYAAILSELLTKLS